MTMSFHQFAEAHGLIITTMMEGRWIRTRTADKPKHRNGAYKYLGDVGFVQNHATMTEVATWRSDKPPTEAQRRFSDAQARALREREAKKRITAIRQMREYWDRLPAFRGEHPYLVRKGLSMMGCKDLRIDGDLLAIPLCSGPSLMSLQTIDPDGAKRYRYGCPIKGNSLLLARPRSVVTCLVEGFATGLAIYQSLPQASVIVCFDAGNMVNVAEKLKVRGMVVVCADNDWQTQNKIGVNTGLEKGRSAAAAIGCGMAYPEGIFGSDWADALAEWKEAGPGRLRVEIMRHAKPVSIGAR
jgi:phage/plasmid primase-like uncharacterized protein